MCKSSKLVCFFLLICLQYLSKSNADDTWGDVKKCSRENVVSCQEKCADSLDTSLRDGAKQCWEDFFLSVLEAEANCLRKNGFDVADSTPCWTAMLAPQYVRERRQSLSEDGGFTEYSKCFYQCALSDPSHKLPQQCRKNCKEISDPKQKEAVRICQDKTGRAYKDLCKDMQNASDQALKCASYLILSAQRKSTD